MDAEEATSLLAAFRQRCRSAQPAVDESPREGTVMSGRCVYGTTQDSYDIHGRRVRLCDYR